MDTYLRCLYQYALDDLLLDARLNLIDYSRRSARQDLAWNALTESLTSEQMNLVEDYILACNRVRSLEDELLFEKAVALGKWMVRQESVR